MAHICTASPLDRSTVLPLVPTPSARGDWSRVADEAVHALDAIRRVAGIAWWDGSAIGLHLHGFIGFFDAGTGLPPSRLEDRF